MEEVSSVVSLDAMKSTKVLSFNKGALIHSKHRLFVSVKYGGEKTYDLLWIPTNSLMNDGACISQQSIPMISIRIECHQQIQPQILRRPVSILVQVQILVMIRLTIREEYRVQVLLFAHRQRKCQPTRLPSAQRRQCNERERKEY